MDLQEVKLLIEEKRAHITKLREEIIDLEKIKLEHETGFKEGDLVECKTGQRGILVFDRSNVWSWRWKKLKKDGTPATNITYLPGWGIKDIKKVS